MKRLFIILSFIPFLAIAQDKGVAFEHNRTWDDIKTKAKAENKYIFVDCFTTWCGPCKYMAKNIFPQEKVGEFFNSNFVNIKIQFDQTAKDSEEVKSWYENAKRFTKDYNIVAYPTFLIFNPDGTLVHRIVGGAETADQFIAKANEALNPETQYATICQNFERNPNNPELAQKVAIAAKKVYDTELAERAMHQYLDLVDPEILFTKENINLFKDGGNVSSSRIFKLLAENKVKADKVLRNEGLDANTILSKILLREFVEPALLEKGTAINFSALKAEIHTAHPYVDMTEALALTKTRYYHSKDWIAFKDAVNEYLRYSSKEVAPSSLNNYAWSIFKNCDDAACLASALEWSRQAIEMENTKSAFLNTYANLLYKSNDTKNAIKWQKKALNLASGPYKEQLNAALVKMKNNLPTWN